MADTKRLFMVRNNNTNEIVKECGTPRYFRRKEDAKKVRDELTEEDGRPDSFSVVFGPDHRKSSL